MRLPIFGTLLTFAALFSNSNLNAQLLEEFQLSAIDGEDGDWFGFQVAVTDDYIVVSAPLDEQGGPNLRGSVYVFEAQTGELRAKLLPSVPIQSSGFGEAIACFGDFVAVGAPSMEVNGVRGGAGLLFRVSTGQQVAQFAPNNLTQGDGFGSSVAIRGDFVAFGAPGDDHGGHANAGTVRLYRVSTGAQVHKWQASDRDAQDAFGESLAMSGDYVIIGAPGDYEPDVIDGSAYLFQRSTGQEVRKLLPGDPTAQEGFGSTVAISDDLAVVGAPGKLYGVTDNFGAAYVFRVSTGAQLHRLASNDIELNCQFGCSVGISDERIVVGAFAVNDFRHHSGAAYSFDAVSGQQTSKLFQSNGHLIPSFGSGHRFGTDVAISGTRAIVGARSAPSPLAASSQDRPGTAYSFDLAAPANSGAPYCFSPGGGSGCPCDQPVTQDEGCPNGTGHGGRLMARGNAYLSEDTLQFVVTDMPSFAPMLMFRGLAQVNGGQGVAPPGSSGLLCASGSLIRSQVSFVHHSDNFGNFFDFRGLPFSQWAVDLSTAHNYQVWYRDGGNECGTGGFNFTNAWTVTWQP